MYHILFVAMALSAIATALYLQVFDSQGTHPRIQVAAYVLNSVGMLLLIAYIVAVAA